VFWPVSLRVVVTKEVKSMVMRLARHHASDAARASVTITKIRHMSLSFLLFFLGVYL
jgi:hypothetical protein